MEPEFDDDKDITAVFDMIGIITSQFPSKLKAPTKVSQVWTYRVNDLETGLVVNPQFNDYKKPLVKRTTIVNDYTLSCVKNESTLQILPPKKNKHANVQSRFRNTYHRVISQRQYNEDRHSKVKDFMTFKVKDFMMLENS